MLLLNERLLGLHGLFCGDFCGRSFRNGLRLGRGFCLGLGLADAEHRFLELLNGALVLLLFVYLRLDTVKLLLVELELLRSYAVFLNDTSVVLLRLFAGFLHRLCDTVGEVRHRDTRKQKHAYKYKYDDDYSSAKSAQKQQKSPYEQSENAAATELHAVLIQRSDDLEKILAGSFSHGKNLHSGAQHEYADAALCDSLSELRTVLCGRNLYSNEYQQRSYQESRIPEQTVHDVKEHTPALALGCGNNSGEGQQDTERKKQHGSQVPALPAVCESFLTLALYLVVQGFSGAPGAAAFSSGLCGSGAGRCVLFLFGVACIFRSTSHFSLLPLYVFRCFSL